MLVGEKFATSVISRDRGLWPRAAVVLLVAFIALWPAFLNGGPFFMADTPSYVRGAASAAYKLFHVHTAWADEYIRVYGNPAAGAQQGEAGVLSRPDADLPVTLKGRSVFYGIFLYSADLAGSFWFAAALQSLLTGLCIYNTVKIVGEVNGVNMRSRDTLLLGVFVALCTPVAFFTSYLMPDIFGGLGLLSISILIFLCNDISNRMKVFWILLLGYSALVHSVNLMLITALAIVSIAYASWRGIRLSRYQLVSLVGCILIGILGQLAFNQAVKVMTGAPPVRPPFVAMRLIADGPGYTYLQKHCSAEPYIYCRVLGRRDLHHDTLLWSTDPQVSLFRGLSADEQRISASQQLPFIVDVFLEQPLRVSGTALRNSLEQLGSLDLRAFNYSSGNISRFRSTIPAELFGEMSVTKAFRNKMPTAATEALTALTVILSCFVILWFLVTGSKDGARGRLSNFYLCLFAGIALNAVICGALSGPKGRYEMRLIWVLPLAAGALAASGFERRRIGRINGAFQRAPA